MVVKQSAIKTLEIIGRANQEMSCPIKISWVGVIDGYTW